MNAQQMAMLRLLLDSLLNTATAIAQLLDTVDEEAEAAGKEETIPTKGRYLGDNDN